MKDTCYLVVNSRGIKSIIRKTRPRLAKGEYAVFVRLEVPDHVFAERPIAEAMITVKADKVVAPPVQLEQLDPPPEPQPPPLTEDPDYKAGLAEG